MADALTEGRLEHPAQVLPECASKAFNRARQIAMEQTNLFDGLMTRAYQNGHARKVLRVDMTLP